MALFACHRSNGQTFAEGVQALCDVPDHVPPPGQGYEQRLAGLQQWAEQNITNPDAKKLGTIDSVRANQGVLADAVKKAGIAHCKLLDNGMELQSFADAMKTVCAAPKDGMPEYFKTHLLNTEVVRTFAALGDVNPAERADKLHALIARAGLAECHALDLEVTVTVEAAPTLTDEPGLEKLDPAGPVLTATTTGITVEGKAIVAVKDGSVDPAELEGGALGVEIPRVSKFLTEIRQHMTATVLRLAVDPTLTYRMLFSLAYTAQKAGFRDLALVVHAGHDLRAIPLTLPEKAPPGAGTAGLRLIVSITKDHLLLWSLSGTEGTLKKPAADVAPDHLADLRKAVAAIAERRKPQGDDQRIIVMADGAIPMQKVAEVMAAVRTDETGKPLFPTVLLSSGFE
jgi:biopolymer transport protein ExbD